MRRGATASEADPFAVASALDWLLYDWLMAHREDPDSAAIQIPKGHDSDASDDCGRGVRVRPCQSQVRPRPCGPDIHQLAPRRAR